MRPETATAAWVHFIPTMRRRRKFSNSFYRNTNSCTYNYDLATSSLFGPGDYSAYLVINSVAVLNPGRFRLE